MVVGTGMLLATGCVNVCCWTVIRPDDVAAMACICAKTQAVAAPMPRTGSVWLEAVCLVPNWVNRKMVAWIRRGSTSRSMARRSLSGCRRGSAEPAPAVAASAGTERARMGAATAVTAEADRNVRRVGRRVPGTALFSIARIHDGPQPESSHSDWCRDPAVAAMRLILAVKHAGCRYAASGDARRCAAHDLR